jgi:hypothetical protein
VLVVNSTALLTTNASVTILSSVSTTSNSAIYSIVVSERAPLRAASMSFEQQRRACEFRTITSHAPHTTSQAPHTTSQAPHTRKSQNAEEMSLINFRSVMTARARRKTAEHNVQARVRGHLPDTPVSSEGMAAYQTGRKVPYLYFLFVMSWEAMPLPPTPTLTSPSTRSIRRNLPRAPRVPLRRVREDRIEAGRQQG